MNQFGRFELLIIIESVDRIREG